MKRRILDAAFDVLRDRGYNGFTTLEVAKRAGVSRGAQVHHFPSKNDLVIAAMEHVFNLSLAYGMNLAKAVRQSEDPVEALIKDASAFYFSDYFLVGLDMLLAADKDPEFRDRAIQVVRNYRQPVEEEWRQVMLRLGFPENKASEILWLTVSILRGAAIRGLWRREPQHIKHCLTVWHDMIAAYLALDTADAPLPAAATLK